LGRYFVHSTGHGIGLEIHEEIPGWLEVKKCSWRLENVITLEPGVYIEGVGESGSKMMRCDPTRGRNTDNRSAGLLEI